MLYLSPTQRRSKLTHRHIAASEALRHQTSLLLFT